MNESRSTALAQGWATEIGRERAPSDLSQNLMGAGVCCTFILGMVYSIFGF